MKNYAQRRAWADTFLEQQFNILNNCISDLDFNKMRRHKVSFDLAPDFDDQNLATDVITVGNLRIALRVRLGESRLYGDIALRSYIPSRRKTEVHKIKEGFGDYYLYCWTIDGVNITEWILIDLDRFREVMDLCLAIFDHFNNDGSAFNTYNIKEMIDHGCCVATCLNTAD